MEAGEGFVHPPDQLFFTSTNGLLADTSYPRYKKRQRLVLGRRLALFTELPTRVLLGNSSYTVAMRILMR